MLLEINHLTKYFGGLLAVSDFNLDLNTGELVGIIGPNGAGKTTVFNLITGVYHPSKGNVLFDDKNIVGKSSDRITASGIARTFQNIRLFNDLTVIDNVRIAAYHQIGYNPLEAMFRVGRFNKQEREYIDYSMNLLAFFKLDTYAGELAKNLPYGLQRRLEITRAMATKPKLLLLDEPAAGINPNEIDQLMEFIQWIRKEFSLTILLIEHQMRLVMGICERIKVLDFGATIAEGTPLEIQNNSKVLEAYLGEGAEL
jgi:branched-chain amino acid transport system ATP-binding protein